MLSEIIQDKFNDVMNNLTDAQIAGLALLDRNLNIIWANNTLPKILRIKYNPIGKPCHDVYNCECRNKENCTTLKAFSSGSKQYSEVQIDTEKGDRKYIQNVSIPIKDAHNNLTHLFKVSVDITEKEEKIHQYGLLRKLAELTQGTLQIDRLLHLILTCVTAGTGLGFNRALLFLVDYESKIIYGKMAVGPSSMEEANVIWNEIKEKYESLEDLIKASENNYQYDSPLHMLTRLMAYSLENEKEIIVDCVKKKKTICERNGSENYHNDKDFAQRIGANEFVCVPLLAREKVLGVICADNLYSKRPITEEQMSLLTTFANHAALAIENADAYKKLEEKIAQLKDAQERLIRSDRMAVMGNMASYIAHEIRNPLVTIGGFARSIARDSDENNKIKKNADIILEEVSRLEKILEVIMGFSKSEKPVKVETQINEILNNTIILMNSYLKSSKISIKKDIDSMLPEIVADPDQIKQVFLNILKNAVESMKHGGELTIETTKENEGIRIIIADTGEGMKAEIMDKIFSPFFTTKNYGTGIGLAVTQRIIDEHEGSIHVKSKVNEGTTFTIYLPVKKD